MVVRGILAAALIATWASVSPALPVRADEPSSGAIPDAAQLAALRDQLKRGQCVRLLGGFGSRELTEPVLDSAGVSSTASIEPLRRRSALMVTAETRLEPPAPVPWNQISQVQIGHSRPLQGALLGALVGVTLGMTLATSLSRGESEGEVYRAVGIFSGTTIGCTVAGSIVGSKVGWRTVYRARPRGSE